MPRSHPGSAKLQATARPARSPRPTRRTATRSTQRTSTTGSPSGIGRHRRPSASTVEPTRHARASTIGSGPGPRSRADQAVDRPRSSEAGPSGHRSGRYRVGMTAAPAEAHAAASISRRLAIWLDQRPRMRLALLLAAPVGWLVVMYLGALVVLFLNSVWLRDEFTGLVSRTLSVANFIEITTT